MHQVRRIAHRAATLWADAGATRAPINFAMDIELCDARLDLDRLEAFRDPDFAHDMAGLTAHLDHETGELRDGFAPRCIAPPPAVEVNGWRLLHKGSNQPARYGELFEGRVLTGGTPPHKPASAGYVQTDGGGAELYAHVLDLFWTHPEHRPL